MPAHQKAPRIVLGGIMHESNSFNAEPTVMSDFIFRQGSDWDSGNSEVAGFVGEGSRLGFDLVRTIYASATPKGPVTSDAFEQLTARLIEPICELGEIDGILLALHGAMYTEEFP